MKNILFIASKIITILEFIVVGFWCALPFALYFTNIQASRYLPAFLGLVTILVAIPAFMQYLRERKIEALLTCHAWLCASIILTSASWKSVLVLEMSYPLSMGLFGTILLVLAAVLFFLYTRKIFLLFDRSRPLNLLLHVKTMLLKPIKSIYITTFLLIILTALYINTDYKYVPQLVLKQPVQEASSSRSPAMVSTQMVATAVTITVDYSDVNLDLFRNDRDITEYPVLGIPNSSGLLTIEVRDGLNRCYQLDEYERCLTLLNTQADKNKFSSIAWPIPNQYKTDKNPISVIGVEEGRMDFKSIKEAIEWIDKDENKPYNLLYTDNGILAGWYKENMPQSAGMAIKTKLFQLYINGEKPAMLPGSRNDAFRFQRKSLPGASISPPRVANPIRSRKVTGGKMKIVIQDTRGREYCWGKTNPYYGEELDPSLLSGDVNVPFLDKKDEQISRALGLSIVRPVVENLIKLKATINRGDVRDVVDPKKIHMTALRKVYYVPDEISDWLAQNKNIFIQGKWFRLNDIDYLLITAALDGKGFIMDGYKVTDPMYKTEALYMFVNNKYGEVMRGDTLYILKIDKEMLIVGERSEQPDEIGGSVIAFDGSKSYKLCNWGYGL